MKKDNSNFFSCSNVSSTCGSDKNAKQVKGWTENVYITDDKLYYSISNSIYSYNYVIDNPTFDSVSWLSKVDDNVKWFFKEQFSLFNKVTGADIVFGK